MTKSNRAVFNKSQNRAFEQRGITMIEVLVTVLVTAIGLLGIAALQSVALKGSMDSSQRTAAASIANDVVDRIRANPAGRNANNYATSFAAANLCANPPAQTCSDRYNQAGAAVVASAACTGAQLATYDAWELACGFDNVDDNMSSPINFLVNPTITVACVDSDATDALACSDNSAHTVTITWSAIARDADRGGVNEQRSMTINTGI